MGSEGKRGPNGRQVIVFFFLYTIFTNFLFVGMTNGLSMQIWWTMGGNPMSSCIIYFSVQILGRILNTSGFSYTSDSSCENLSNFHNFQNLSLWTCGKSDMACELVSLPTFSTCTRWYHLVQVVTSNVSKHWCNVHLFLLKVENKQN